MNIFSQYPKLFNGVGLYKNGKVSLHIDHNIRPMTQAHRRIPFHLRKQVEKQLEELENNDIIEEVSGSTPWVSPIVLVPKPKDPTKYRLCVDMRQPNKAIMRERHLTPTIDDIIVKINGTKLFSKLDLNQGYHQIELDEKSR